MKKIWLILVIVSFGGCSNFKINSTMCDDIGLGSDRDINQIPKECRNYNEKEADKAFFKDKEQREADVDDIIEFEKEEEER